ncbi:mechanosensitive ion channel family protein [Pseudoduganella lutea]|uniref:Mechanosensitive ion channel family protein n=1 Tax=Pseudoduganella lutea TaxID=321985 RepID=A0A4P6L2Y4_9BURK|nr:mechanosensitive ion channel family protein [Pseudoduganella lutea]QBE65744.1 mechanosensitive ion channel family protein [Pseudoduganella lutea]
MTGFHYTLLGNDVTAWVVAVGIAVTVAAVLYAVNAMVLHRLRRMAVRTETFLDDVAVTVLAATTKLFMLVMGIYAGSQWLALSPKLTMLLAHAAIVVLLLQVARWGDVGIRNWLEHYGARRSAQDAASTTSTAAMGFVLRTVLWLVIVLMILDNFGVNITTLVASLGIGGIAVALATQNILGDLFSSLSIVLDKPFVVGDFIIVNDMLGTVEYVGLKTTRLRSLGGEQIVFSNTDLLKSRIRNYQHMEQRRVVFGFGAGYDTTAEQVLAIPAIVRDIVEALPDVRFDRAHFKAYSPSSLDFEVVFYVTTPDYTVYMDRQQAINVALLQRLRAEGIAFGHPLQMVRVAEGELLTALEKCAA